MDQRPSLISDDLPELNATQLLSLEIDVELRDVWEQLDQRPDLWDDLLLRVTACAMRVAFERGRCQGEAADKDDAYEKGYSAGYEQGHEEGYEEGYDDAITKSQP
jgi:hypothetical protein